MQVSLAATVPTRRTPAKSDSGSDRRAALKALRGYLRRFLMLRVAKILVEAEILSREQRGKWAYYRLIPDTLADLPGSSTREDQPPVRVGSFAASRVSSSACMPCWPWRVASPNERASFAIPTLTRGSPSGADRPAY